MRRYPECLSIETQIIGESLVEFAGPDGDFHTIDGR